MAGLWRSPATCINRIVSASVSMPQDGRDQRTSELSAGDVLATAVSIRIRRSPLTCCSQLADAVSSILQRGHSRMLSLTETNRGWPGHGE